MRELLMVTSRHIIRQNIVARMTDSFPFGPEAQALRRVALLRAKDARIFTR
jgi:hypothetical protein